MCQPHVTKALKLPKGKYIMFVNPDDYVKKHFIGAAAAKIEEKNADMVIFGYSSPWFRTPSTWGRLSSCQGLPVCDKRRGY